MCCPSLFRPVVLHARWRRQERVCTLCSHLRPPSFAQHREMCHRLKYKCRYLALATRVGTKRSPRCKEPLQRRWDEVVGACAAPTAMRTRWTAVGRANRIKGKDDGPFHRAPRETKKIRHGCRQGMLPRGATESSGERARDEGRVQGEAMSGFRNAALRQRQCARSRTNQNKAVAMTEPC